MDEGQKQQLVIEYDAAVRAYSEAVSRLVGLTGEAYDTAYKQVEALYEQVEQRRAALRKHEGGSR